MDEVQLINEARFIALEYAMALALKGVYVALKLTPEEIATAHRSLKENLQRRTFPELDAAFSDLLAAEIENAVERLFQRVALMDRPRSS